MKQGTHFSDETLRKMSESAKRYHSTHDGYWKGRKRTPENKANVGRGMRKFWDEVKQLRNERDVRRGKGIKVEVDEHERRRPETSSG